MSLLFPCTFHPLQVVLDRVKNAERLPGVDEILLPSERGNRVAQQRLSSGMVPIEANLYHNLKVGLQLGES
jgi:LDH2 family malate/lactate/ureidoglycolate dehydrogenase